jgi:ribose transport system substrate-binding protein
MRRGGYVALALTATLALAGCGGAPDYKYRIAVIPKGTTHEFWKSIKAGAERAADDLAGRGVKVQVHWDGPFKESDALEQIGIIDRNIGARVHGIVLAPQHSEQMVPPVERAREQNVPVVIIDSGLKREDLIVKYVATDNHNGGKLAAEHLLKVLQEQGKEAPKLVLFRYAPGSESTEQRESGFLDHVAAVKAEWEKAGKPAPAIVDDKEYAGATVETAEKAAGPLLTRLGGDKGIDGIFAVNESATNGMLNALRSLGLQKKIRLVGFDSSEPLLQALEKDEDLDGLIVQDPYRMGYLGVWTLVQHLEGYEVAPNGEKRLSTGEYVLTRANFGEAKSRELIDPKVRPQRTIETPTYSKK